MLTVPKRQSQTANGGPRVTVPRRSSLPRACPRRRPLPRAPGHGRAGAGMLRFVFYAGAWRPSSSSRRVRAAPDPWGAAAECAGVRDSERGHGWPPARPLAPPRPPHLRRAQIGGRSRKSATRSVRAPAHTHAKARTTFTTRIATISYTGVAGSGGVAHAAARAVMYRCPSTFLLTRRDRRFICELRASPGAAHAQFVVRGSYE